MADPLTRTIVYTYDLAGNKTALTVPLGRTTQYGYDADDEVTSIGYSDGQTPNVAYTYTATGQRRTMADGTGTTNYQYDALDRPITVTNGARQRVGYGYDAVGNVTALTYPDSSVVTRTYDALDRLSGVTDWLGHSTTFGYDANSNLITETLPNTTSVAQAYNAADQLTGITDTTPLTTWAYGYGRDLLGQVTASNDPLDGKAHSYAYSPLDQLTGDGVTSGGAPITSTWTVNGAYEIGQRADASGSYTSMLTYDPAHEVTGLSTISGTATTENLAFAYNGDGDRTSQTDSVSGAGASYGYDQADRVTSAAISTTTGSTTASYTYDGDGLRQSKIVTTPQGTTMTSETWDTAGSLPTLLQDGAARYIVGPDGLPIGQVSTDSKGNGTILYYLHDQLGSTRALLDGAGNTQATYSYDLYGNVTAHTGSATTPFQFTGQYIDAETGLQYLRARYYDPTTSQFVSRDPLESVTKQPYAYTADNPLNAIDPLGLAGCSLSPGDWGNCASQLWNGVVTSGRNYARSNPQAYNGPGYKTARALWRLIGWNPPNSPAEDANSSAYLCPPGTTPVSFPAFGSVQVGPAGEEQPAPDYVVTPNGEVILVPDGATGPSPTKNGKGFQYRGGSGGKGFDSRTTTTRVMDPRYDTDPTKTYPGGYVSHSNASDQTIDPYTGVHGHVESPTDGQLMVPIRGEPADGSPSPAHAKAVPRQGELVLQGAGTGPSAL